MYTIDMIWLRKRQVGTDEAGLMAALLFALPGVRQVQPDVPPIGVSIDALSFFWNMMLVAIALVLMLSAQIGDYRGEEEMEEEEEAPAHIQ